MSKGFPAKTRFKSYFVVIVSYWLFPTRNIFKFLINLTFSNCSILFKRTIVSSVLKVPLNPYQPVRMYRYVYSSYWLIFSKCCLTVSVFFHVGVDCRLLRRQFLSYCESQRSVHWQYRTAPWKIHESVASSYQGGQRYLMRDMCYMCCIHWYASSAKSQGVFRGGGVSLFSLSCSPNNGSEKELFQL